MMFATRHPATAGGCSLAAIVAMGILSVPYPAAAETIINVNDVPIDSTVLEAYMATRIQKPFDQVTVEEKAALLDELTSIYALATADRSKEIALDPNIAAQIELQRIGIIANATAAVLQNEITVSDEEIAAEYEEQVALSPKEQYKARHILVETQAEAIEIIETLIAGGDFAELAKEKSTGPSGPSGGDLDWFTSNQMVAPFSQAVMRLENGRYTTDPVQTQFGWHIILREDSKPTVPPPLESVRENLHASVQQKKLQAMITEMKTEAVSTP